MTRVAVIVAMVSALCLGVSIGFVGGVMFSRHLQLGGPPLHMGIGFERHFPRLFHRGPQGRDGMPSPRMMVSHLQRLLDLTPEQADAVRGEIERTRGDFAQVRDSLHARIERLLTPQQRERWRSVVRERNLDEPGGPGPHTLRANPGTEGERSR